MWIKLLNKKVLHFEFFDWGRTQKGENKAVKMLINDSMTEILDSAGELNALYKLSKPQEKPVWLLGENDRDGNFYITDKSTGEKLLDCTIAFGLWGVNSIDITLLDLSKGKPILPDSTVFSLHKIYRNALIYGEAWK